MLSSDLIEDIAATAEVCGGSKWSAAAVRIACVHLGQFAEPSIRQSLLRCQQEVKGTLALADIIARMPERAAASMAGIRSSAARMGIGTTSTARLRPVARNASSTAGAAAREPAVTVRDVAVCAVTVAGVPAAV